MTQWALAITAAFFAIVSVAAGAVALTDDDSVGTRIAQDADGRGESGGDGSAGDCANPPCEDTGDGGVAGICLEGAVDCDDTIDTRPVDDICNQIVPTPPECTDPDTPVTNEPGQQGGSDPGESGSSGLSAECTLEFPNECAGEAASLADLAARLDVEKEAITVGSVERVDWPNACLGIEQPDVACAEIITTGYRIILEANGQKYEYHTDGGSRVLLVE